MQRSHKEEQEVERETTKEEIVAAITQERQRAKVGTTTPTLLKLTTTVVINSSPLHVKITTSLLLPPLFLYPLFFCLFFLYFSPLSSLSTFSTSPHLLAPPFPSPSFLPSFVFSSPSPFLLALLPRNCYQRLCKRSDRGQKLQWREPLRTPGNGCKRKCRT